MAYTEHNKPYNYWTEERIRKFIKAHNIKTRTELLKFRKDDNITGSGAYNAASKLGILDDLFPKKQFVWEKEMCAEAAMKCQTRNEFFKKYRAEYYAAKKHGWFEEITEHMPPLKYTKQDCSYRSEKKIRNSKAKNHVIYAYEIPEYNSVYVGLTKDLKYRDRQHRSNYDGRDKIYKFCKSVSIEMPEPIILKEDITAEEAKRFEAIYWYYYRDEGWNMINTEYALGILGGRYTKWDKEMVYDYLKEHPEIKNRGDFCEMCRSGYKAAKELGLLDELFGKKTRCDFYVKEDIIKYVNEHSEIKSREDLRQAKPGMFKAAWKFKMFDELFGEITNKEHTKDDILNYLNEHPEINSREIFRTINRNLYEAARKKKMLQDLFGDKQRNIKWFRESIIDYIKNNPDIKTQTDLYYKCVCAYNAARDLNMLVELFGEPTRQRHTRESILNYMKEHPEIKRRVDLHKQNNKLLQAARALGMLDELFGKVRSDVVWDKQSIIDFVKNNSDIKQREDLRKKDRRAYDAAIKLNLLDSLFGETRICHYTKEDIFNYLKEHPEIKRRVDLQNQHPKMYSYAVRHNLMFELFGERQRSIKWSKEAIIEYVKNNPEIKTEQLLKRKKLCAYEAAKRLNILDDLFHMHN